MAHFLKVVAESYHKRYTDLSRLAFIMPNKRSGTFLLEKLRALNEKPGFSPRIIPIDDFVGDIIPLVKDSRLDMLFRLYRAYIGLPGADSEMTFEQFSSWGETLLNDFNEIDMQMVDAEGMFKNVYDINAIRSNFLTNAQKRVMTRYFGYSPEILEQRFANLWKHFDDPSGGEAGGKRRTSKKFYALWQLLLPLYTAFKDGLKANGLTSEGGAYREAALMVERGEEPYPGEKLVFVGFNALSDAECRLFRALKGMEIEVDTKTEGRIKEPKADFIWDRVADFFAGEEEPAARYVGFNMKKENFPPPAWIEGALERSVPLEGPKIEIISVPSNIMQTKVAGMELEKIPDETAADKEAAARIAVVLPDENLLLPMLYSLPDKFANPNLTMGFPLKHTSVISFAGLLRRLHQNSRISSGRDTVYFFDDVKALLAHPYARILFDREEINKFIDWYQKKRKLVVPSGTLAELGKDAAALFHPISHTATPVEVTDYITGIIQRVGSRLNGNERKGYLVSKVEKTYIATYADALARLRNCIGEYDVRLTAGEVFALADRLIAGEKVVFEGEPLEGLQVMGVLETRCLDFERIIMLSVNEKVMPRVGRNSTFIPNIIRVAFGMPPANYQEEIFAYYFFRVLGRCEQGTLTYDSRASENRTPGPSRYLLQLKYLSSGIELKEREVNFELPKPLEGGLEFEKNEEIRRRLRLYLRDDEGNPVPHEEDEKPKQFSPSALKNYFQCPVKFLFNNIAGLYLEEEKTETLSPTELGTIVHKTIESLYFPKDERGRLLATPIVMTGERIREILRARLATGESLIEAEARKALMFTHFELRDGEEERAKPDGSSLILLPFIVKYVRFILEADLEIAPFRLWGSEISMTFGYDIGGEKVGVKLVIDRLDQEGGTGDNAPFRIVDYKTGRVHLTADNLDQLFDGSFGADNIFQLIFYAELFVYALRTNKLKLPAGVNLEELERNLKMVIYDVVGLESDKTGAMRPPVIGKVPGKKGQLTGRKISTLGDLRVYEEETGQKFLDRLHETIKEILDNDRPLCAEPNEDRCHFCAYRLHCEALRARKESGGI